MIHISSYLGYLQSLQALPVVSKNQQTMPASVRLDGPTISIPMTKQAASIPAIANPANTRAQTKLKLDFRFREDKTNIFFPPPENII